MNETRRLLILPLLSALVTLVGLCLVWLGELPPNALAWAVIVPFLMVGLLPWLFASKPSSSVAWKGLLVLLLIGLALRLVSLGVLDDRMEDRGYRLFWETRLLQAGEPPCSWSLDHNPRGDLNSDGLRFLIEAPTRHACQSPGALLAASWLEPLHSPSGFFSGKSLLLGADVLGMLVTMLLVLKRRKPWWWIAPWAVAAALILPLIRGMPLQVLGILPLGLSLLFLEYGWRRLAMPLLAVSTLFMPLVALMVLPILWKYREESAHSLILPFALPALLVWLPWIAWNGPEGLRAMTMIQDWAAVNNPLFLLLGMKLSLAQLNALRVSLLLAGILWSLRYQPNRLWGMGAVWVAVVITSPELTPAHGLLLLPFWSLFPSLGVLFLIALWTPLGLLSASPGSLVLVSVVGITFVGFVTDTILLFKRGPDRSWQSPDE